jgi:hypothetical protein
MGENLYHLFIWQALLPRAYKELKEIKPKTNGYEHEKISTPLAIREMQIKTILKFHLTPVKMTIIKITKNQKCW